MLVKNARGHATRYTVEEKIEAVRQRMYQELSYQGILEKYGISSSTLKTWLQKYKAEVLRRVSPKDIPLYVRKYQETMSPEEEDELSRLRRENEDLKLINEANLLMIDMIRERYQLDVKKTPGRCYPSGCRREECRAWTPPGRVVMPSLRLQQAGLLPGAAAGR